MTPALPDTMLEAVLRNPLRLWPFAVIALSFVPIVLLGGVIIAGNDRSKP